MNEETNKGEYEDGAEQAAAEFDAEAVDGYHVLVQREDIDAVLVLSPHWFRALPILAACESRKAV